MPKVGVNSEPLHERLVFGYDGTDYQVVKIDTDGNLVVALKATEDVQANTYGWIGAAWQKAPMPFGLSGRVAEIVTDLNTGAGTDSISTTAVPAGEYHVLTQVSFYVASATCVNLIVYLKTGGAVPPLFGQTSPTSSQIYDRQGWWVLAPGDFVQLYGFNLTAGDDLSVSVAGFRIDIDQ